MPRLEIAGWRGGKFYVACGFLIAILAAAIPLLFSSSFGLSRVEVVLVYVIVGIGANLVFGSAGDIALGFAVTMGVAAYVAGMLSALLALGFPECVVLGIAAGTVFGTVTLLPGLRVRGFYLGLVTLFLIFVLPDAVLLGQQWTGGENGLTGIRPAAIAGVPLPSWVLYEITYAFALISWLVTRNLAMSGWGLRLKALRDAPRAGESVGINLTSTRIVGYILSSAIVSAAGVMFAYSEQFVNSQEFGVDLTMLILTGVILGGKGTVVGPLLGVIPLGILTLYVGEFSDFNPIVFGVLLLATIIFLPNGIVPWLKERFAPKSRPLAEARTVSEKGHGAAPSLSPTNVAEPSQPLLEVDGISVHFGGLKALQDVRLKMEPGELVGLVGANGSGKSTLLNVINGFVRPDSGRVIFGGRDLVGSSAVHISRLGIGRTFQIPQLVNELSVGENLELGLLQSYPACLAGTLVRSSRCVADEQDRERRIEAIWSLLGLSPSVLSTPAGELPLGMKRLVELGRAVANRPNLLLLDEPAAGLNEVERDALGGMLRVVSKTGIGILLVSHNVRFVMTYCHSLVLMDSGRNVVQTVLDGRELPEAIQTYLRYGLISEITS